MQQEKRILSVNWGRSDFSVWGKKARPAPPPPQDCQHHQTQHLQTPDSAHACREGEAGEDATHSLQVFWQKSAHLPLLLLSELTAIKAPAWPRAVLGCGVGHQGCDSILLPFHLEAPPSSPSQINQPHGKAVSTQNGGRTRASVPCG